MNDIGVADPSSRLPPWWECLRHLFIWFIILSWSRIACALEPMLGRA